MSEKTIDQLRTIADDLMDAEFAASVLRRKRDALIVEAAASGASLRMLGDIALVSHQTIKNILDRAATPGA